MRDVVGVTDEVLLYQPARVQDWCAEQTFDVSCDPDGEEVSYHTATMRGDEEWRPCLDTAEQHRNTKTNSTHNKKICSESQPQTIPPVTLMLTFLEAPAKEGRMQPSLTQAY